MKMEKLLRDGGDGLKVITDLKMLGIWKCLFLLNRANDPNKGKICITTMDWWRSGGVGEKRP